MILFPTIINPVLTLNDVGDALNHALNLSPASRTSSNPPELET